MELKTLTLKNFRCYKDLSVSFHPQLTVLVAINGEGKTSVLDALRIGFWSFVSQFDLARTAYRCVLLNSHLGLQAADKTTGVILIDEVDMHLHPQWQQNVLGSLAKAFPSLQFVVTTHSPQVLTTVASKSIRVIKEGELFAAPKGSQGAEASRLLKSIFDVDVRPPLEKNTQDLEEYAQLVYADKWTSDRAVELRQMLDEVFGNEEPKLTELDLHIENREWEQSLEED